MSMITSECMTLGDLLMRASQCAGDRDAVVFPDERLTYAELAQGAQDIARGLIGLGLERGGHVGVLMANSPECVATIFGVALAGGVIVPINTRYRAVELPYVVSDAQLAAIVTSDRIDDYVDLQALLREALPGLADAADPEALRLEAAPALRAVVVLGARRAAGTVNEERLAAAAAAVDAEALERRSAAVRVRDTALLLYTSGTTALPRGCVLTHEALVRAWRSVGEILAVDADDRVWAPCPLFHLGAIGPLVACVSAGAAFLSDTWYRPSEALALLERERATVLYPAYPPITQALLTAPGFADADLSASRAMLNVAPPDTLRSMQAALPHVTQVSLYGLTEAGGAVTYTRLDDDLAARTETCGRPLPGAEVRIGADGEIVIRSVSLFEGYWNDPEKTAATLQPDGWFHTGDRGELDAAGRLRFLGRLKDMLKVGGENVAPAEIESLLSTHPAVKLVQVVGVPDARLEEVPAAFVELRPGHAATEEELLRFCTGRIARFKIPRHVRFVTEWPLSATKIQKAPLRERLIAELQR